MSDFVEIDMRGLEEFERKFKRMGKRGEAAMMKAMSDAATEGVTEMKRKENMPVVTGRLRSSIHKETPKTAQYSYKDRKGQLYIGGFQQKPVGLSVALGTNVNYAEDVNKNSPVGRGFFEKGWSVTKKALPVRMQKELDKLMNERL